MRGSKHTLAMLCVAGLALTACGGDDDDTPNRDSGAPATQAPSGDDEPAGTDAPTAAPTVVKIGVPLDTTGPAAIAGLGANELNGVKLALSEIEESGFLGDIDIELVEIDTKGDKQEAVAAVLKLVESDKVDAIIGFTLTPSFAAAAPQAVEAGLPVIAVGLAGQGVTELGDTVFRILPNVAAQYAATDVAVAEALGITKMAFLYSSDSETTVGIHQTRKAALEAAGVEVVIEQTASTGDTDYRAQLTEIQKSDAEAVVLSALPGQFPPIFLQAEELGLDLPMLPIDGAGRDEVLDQAASAMQCTIYNAVWAAQNEAGRNPAFMEAVRAEFDDEPDLYYAVGYDAMWAYATALQAVGTADADAVVAALHGLENFEGTLGVYGFDENREPTVDGTRVQIVDGEVALWDPAATCER